MGRDPEGPSGTPRRAPGVGALEDFGGQAQLDLANTHGVGSVYYAAPRTFGGTISYRWEASDC